MVKSESIKKLIALQFSELKKEIFYILILQNLQSSLGEWRFYSVPLLVVLLGALPREVGAGAHGVGRRWSPVGGVRVRGYRTS